MRILGLVVVAVCTLVAASTASAQHRSDGLGACRPSDVDLALGRPVASMTGEDADLLVLTNRSARACVLDGYPDVTVERGGKPLAFTYTRTGAYVTARMPHRVTLVPGHHGYFVVAKYRCDGRVLSTATSIRVSLPGSTTSFYLSLTRGGASAFDFCERYPGDHLVDPGNRVEVSPVEGSVSATTAGS